MENDIIQAISSVGFPIVACIYMGYINREQTKSHEAEMASMRDAINDLKLAIQSLTDYIKK